MLPIFLEMLSALEPLIWMHTRIEPLTRGVSHSRAEFQILFFASGISLEATSREENNLKLETRINQISVQFPISIFKILVQNMN